MVRAVLATAAALMLVGVLSLLIIESRAVKENYYIAHAERLRAIESSRDNINAIVQGARGAFEEGRAIPISMNLAYANLTENLNRLQVPTDPVATDSLAPARLAAYEQQLQQFLNSGQAFAARQNAQAEALRLLQEVSPTVVKDLRRFNLRIESQNAFSLALDVIEFAMGRNASSPEQLAGRIDAMRNNENVTSEAPGRLDAFAAAANTIVQEHTAAEAALADISNSAIADELSALSGAILDDNRRIVSRAERARLLLAVCAVLLLLGAGYAMIRLQNSYRELNKSNADLAKLNDSLEQRVAARTEELSEAYDELKESQVQLVQAEKMSSLGELVAGISHEINTPLWYLMSNSAVIQERLADIGEFLEVAETMVAAAKRRSGVKEAVSAGLVDMHRMLSAGMKDDIDEAKDLVQDSMEGLEELTELAQSLKDFSRLDRAKQGEFNVNDGLNKTLLIIRNKIKNKVTVDKHFGEVPSILCSPSQINQVFLNLIVNAADAIENEGEIVLRTWEKDGKVGVSISDTGCGIPEDELSKVRDPFFTTKEVGKGTGLGLSIVDQIITSHHGELSIESTPGKGTIITVELPLEPPAEKADDDMSVAVTAASKTKADAAPAVTDTGESDWAGDTNVVAGNDAPASAAETKADATANNDNAEDWAGDTNVVAKEDAPTTAAKGETVTETDAEEDDWAGETSVSEAQVFTDESTVASNDAPDTNPGEARAETQGDADWATDTNVVNGRVVTDNADNDDIAIGPEDEESPVDINAEDYDDDVDTHAETDVTSLEIAAAAIRAADEADDAHAETDVSPIGDSGNNDADINAAIATDDQATAADVRIDNEVIELFARSGTSDKENGPDMKKKDSLKKGNIAEVTAAETTPLNDRQNTEQRDE